MDSFVYDMMLDSSMSSQDSSFMSFCLNSTFKQTQFKAKKKQKLSKIFIKKIFKRREKIVVKEKQTRLSRRITKLMDKSLGWLSKRSKKVTSENQLNENFISHEEIMDLNEKFYFHDSSYVLSAPSMCSSFDATKSKNRRVQDQCHSTPRSLLQQFSPIKNTVISPSLCRTSSPMSLNRNIFEQSSQIIDIRLLEHLNDVKRNIKLEVDSRRSDASIDFSLIVEKRKKLKKIFQNRIRKQLREAKKWNLDEKMQLNSRRQSINKKINHSNFSRADRFYTNECCRHCHKMIHNQNYFYNFYNMPCHMDMYHQNFISHPYVPNSYFNRMPAYY